MISIDGARRCILVVALQIEVRARIARLLQSTGYAVELADNQKRALELASAGQIEAAIVVPSSELGSLSEQLRDIIPRTIVLVHGQGETIPGADCSLQEVCWQTLLDQLGRPPARPGCAGAETASRQVLKINDCKVDFSAHTFVGADGAEVHLTRAETALLAAMVCNPCRVLSRDELCRAVVGHGAQPYDRNIDMLVSRLRRKIEADPKSPRFILTLPGIGYKFATRPQSIETGEWPPAIDREHPRQAQTSVPSQVGSPNVESGSRQLTMDDLQREFDAVKGELAELRARLGRRGSLGIRHA